MVDSNQKDESFEPEVELPIGEQPAHEVALSSEELDELEEGIREYSPGYNALLRAIGQIGYRESPTNCQRFSAWFGVACDYWCAFFIAWCFDTSASGNRNRSVPWSSYGTGSSQGIYNWARANRLLVTTPRTGDIFVLRTFQHSGIVRGVNTSTGAFTSVDGNWSDAVSLVSRNYRGGSYYFVRIATSPTI